MHDLTMNLQMQVTRKKSQKLLYMPWIWERHKMFKYKEKKTPKNNVSAYDLRYEKVGAVL